ncbi:MAG: radical SAM protein [Clostridiales bacterium]|jgi:DNA repair photolyase|nr:radical SAM protein [Clostridiales bacterium]
MEEITRKSLLYKTSVEYGDYTVNHAEGCSHGCKYPCYAMMLAKRFGKVKSYDDWCRPKIVANALELFDKEIPRLKSKIKEVHLCFTTDPFMYGYDEISNMSIEIIKKLNNNGIKCTALTKGILPKELAELSKENEYGITLISLNEDFRRDMENGSAPYIERINALKQLHDKGMKTWVSIEPYPTPNFIEQDINEILNALFFVDKIIFGRLNYNAKVSQYKDYKNFFNQTAQTVIDYCVKNKKRYHIKDGTITQ